VIIFRDSIPATDAIRVWTRLHPHGVSLHHTRLPDSVGTGLSDDPNLANEDKSRDTIPAVMCVAWVKAERDESSRRPAVASPTAPCPFHHSRGGKATLPRWEDARSSLGEGPASLSQTLGLLWEARLASHET
jgi:hypothetical protein